MLPPEWHRQAFVQLTWPDENTDWGYIIDDALICFYNMAREICRRESLLIVARNVSEVINQLESGLDGVIPEDERIPIDVLLEKVTFFETDINDTWARDHAFVSCLYDNVPLMMDFRFNGWGLKFPACHDNQINSKLFSSGIIDEMYRKTCKAKPSYACFLDFVLEGGSIESDGKGTVMTTESCLLAPNRNEPMDKDSIEKQILQALGAKRVVWISHGSLEGDDTDGHIDTLARFCPDDTIAYVKCYDSNDTHYEQLRMMEQQLQELRTIDGKPYRLVPLPLNRPIYDEDDMRLPATYANFMILNGAVLMPAYRQPDLDAMAQEQLKTAFPEHEIVPVDATVLIRQHGSIHCSCMQYPALFD